MLKRHFQKLLKRSKNTSDTPVNGSQWIDMIGLGGSVSGNGRRVSTKSALQYSPFWACVRVISSTIASMGVSVKQYDNKSQGYAPAFHHALHQIFKRQTNSLGMTPYNFLMTMGVNQLVHGNAYALIVRDPDTSEVVELLPLDATKVMPLYVNGGQLAYKYTNQGKTNYYYAEDMLHFRHLTLNGIEGLSPLMFHKETIALGQDLQDFASSFFGRGAIPSGVLESEKPLPVEVQERLKHTFTKTYAGLDNSHKAMLLEDGITYKPLTMNMDEVQLLEARKHSAADMGRIHGVPLHMIQELDKATYSNITEQAQSFIKDTIQPITRAWVQELELKLVNATEVGQVQLVFDAKEYLRGDPKTSAQYYKDGMSAGWITGNEIREMEGLKPIEGLEKPFVPMNMRPIDQPVETSKTVRAVWSMARNRLENFEKRILNSAKPKTFEDYKRFVERELIDMQDAIAFVSRQTARDIAHLSDSYIQKRFMKFETLSDNKNIRDLPDLVNALEGLESKESSNV